MFGYKLNVYSMCTEHLHGSGKYIHEKALSLSEHHRCAINTFSLVYTVRVMDFFASITCACVLQMIRTTYVQINVPTPPAKCLGIPVNYPLSIAGL